MIFTYKIIWGVWGAKPPSRRRRKILKIEIKTPPSIRNFLKAVGGGFYYAIEGMQGAEIMYRIFVDRYL